MKVDIAKFNRLVHKAMTKHTNWRYGQTLFNVLNVMNPDLADSIRGTYYDTYYTEDQARIDKFFAWLSI